MFVVKPSPNTAIQICRNKGATEKTSRKNPVCDNVFKVLAKKVIFISKNGGTTKTKFKP